MREGESGKGWVIAAVVAGAGVLLVAVLAAVALVALKFLAAAEPYPPPPKIEVPKTTIEVTVEVTVTLDVEGSKDGKVKYHVGGEDPVEGEKALTAAVRKQVAKFKKKDFDVVSMKIEVINYSGVTNDTLLAAKAACEAAGAKVEKLPDVPLMEGVNAHGVIGYRNADGSRGVVLDVKADGTYSFGGAPAKDKAALAKVLKWYVKGKGKRLTVEIKPEAGAKYARVLAAKSVIEAAGAKTKMVTANEEKKP